jgi:hypothetical protein
LEGRAISFATPDQFETIGAIQKIIRTDIPVAQHPDFPSESFLLTPTSAFAKPKPSGGKFFGRSFRARGPRFRRR